MDSRLRLSKAAMEYKSLPHYMDEIEVIDTAIREGAVGDQSIEALEKHKYALQRKANAMETAIDKITDRIPYSRRGSVRQALTDRLCYGVPLTRLEDTLKVSRRTVSNYGKRVLECAAAELEAEWQARADEIDANAAVYAGKLANVLSWHNETGKAYLSLIDMRFFLDIPDSILDEELCSGIVPAVVAALTDRYEDLKMFPYVDSYCDDYSNAVKGFCITFTPTFETVLSDFIGQPPTA